MALDWSAVSAGAAVGIVDGAGRICGDEGRLVWRDDGCCCCCCAVSDILARGDVSDWSMAAMASTRAALLG